MIFTFAGNILTFDSTKTVGTFFSSFYGDTSATNIIDVTSMITPTINSYPISIFTIQQTGFNRYNEFYLYVLYDDFTLPIVNSYLFINDDNFGYVSYVVNNISPMNTINSVGLSLFCGYICDTIIDGENAYVNSTALGLIGGNDINSGSCGGPYGDFYYKNNQLFGLSDDIANAQMKGSDVLVDLNSIVSSNSSSFSLYFNSQSPNNETNAVWSFFLTYTNNCDTFTTTITANDTICFGDSVQLQATGGVQYSWFGAFGGLNDTSIANPMASPPQTSTYIVTIKNDSGCVKTEQVKIWVNPLPKTDTLITTNNICGDSVGSLQIGNIPNGMAPFTYSLTNLITNNSQSLISNLFNGLGTANYSIQITDANGCQYTDTISITQTNNVQANFTANPQNGVAPLLIDFTNTTTGANNFSWFITNQQGDTINQIPVCTGMTFNCGMSYTFDSSGTYQVCLIAYNNILTCADTICKTILVEESTEIAFVIPNVFTPNGDGNNDNFGFQLTGADLIKELKVEIFNRWGMLVAGTQLLVDSFNQIPNTNNQQLSIWDGRTTAGKEVPAGTYFYVVSYTSASLSTGSTTNKEPKTLKGSVTLLR